MQSVFQCGVKAPRGVVSIGWAFSARYLHYNSVIFYWSVSPLSSIYSLINIIKNGACQYVARVTPVGLYLRAITSTHDPQQISLLTQLGDFCFATRPFLPFPSMPDTTRKRKQALESIQEEDAPPSNKRTKVLADTAVDKGVLVHFLYTFVLTFLQQKMKVKDAPNARHKEKEVQGPSSRRFLQNSKPPMFHQREN
jgi:hypothetical protein